MKRILIVAAAGLLVLIVVAAGYLLLTSTHRTGGEPTVLVLPAEPGDSLERVVILHTNDFHGAIEPEGKGDGK